MNVLHRVLEGRIVRHAAGARLAVGTLVAFGIASTATVVVQAVALAQLLASAFGGADHTNRTLLLVWLAAAAVARACLAFGSELVANLAATSSKATFRSLLVNAAFECSPRPGAISTGDVATLAGRGLDALDVYVGRCIPDLVLAVVAPVALVVTVGVLDWLSALILLCVLTLFPVFGALVGRTGAQLARERWKQVRALGNHLLDLFEGLPVLKAFGRSADERETVKQACEALRSASIATLRVAFVSALVLDTLASVSVALVAVPLGLRLLHGSIGLAPALTVLVIAPEVFLPLRRASAEFHESAEGLAAASDAYSIIDSVTTATTSTTATIPITATIPATADDVLDTPDPRMVPLTLSSVCYAFPGSPRSVLSECTLTIAPGETVAVTGPNGAGKSTLLAMVLGLMAPDSGSISVGGRELQQIMPTSWHRRLAYLPDRPAILATSLAQNLRVANPQASDEDLVAALAAVGAQDIFGSLPLGLRTAIGEGARPVSSGERQRIGLARIMLREASLYVLDEPTVHLDSDTEQQTIQALRARLAGRSAIVVTHRVAPLAIANRVFQLHDGGILAPYRLEDQMAPPPVKA
ncbi:MAG: thiol reductant ABC exporter subunit CydD [Acidimicrobiales bacterium]|jgi:thiol reductant ABC exporter CydD subunit